MKFLKNKTIKKAWFLFAIVHMTIVPLGVVGVAYYNYILNTESYFSPDDISDFVQTQEFWEAIGMGFVMAVIVTICLYHIWTDNFPADHYSGKRIFVVIGFSLGFLLLEVFMAQLIIVMHLYPHH